MKRSVPWFGCVLLVILMVRLGAEGEGNHYPWLQGEAVAESIAQRISAPPGFRRVMLRPGSFAHWLRHLPLKPAGTPVFLYNGQKKTDQAVHHAVIDIDTGARNLQQCADAVLRLRAEYLFSRGRSREIVFRFTSGDRFSFPAWLSGERPVVRGNRVTWIRGPAVTSGHGALRRFLDTLFMYAGSRSLFRDTLSRSLRAMRIGDIFVQGGSPGHAVLVVDLARDERSGETVFLLAQSYMPAQDMHILVNSGEPALSPWYRLPAGETLITPEWTFQRNDLRGFPPQAQPTERPGTGSDSG